MAKLKKPMNLPGNAKKPTSPNFGMKKAPAAKKMPKGTSSKKPAGVN